jgi:tetratricopeptide (TPR) repeat protein
MKSFRFFHLILLGIVGMTVGCATRAVQTQALLSTPLAVAESHVINDVEFQKQTTNYCGPTTLAMAFRWHGLNISPKDLGEQVYTPGLQGSLPMDMETATRRHGFLALPINKMQSLISEIANDRPVVVMQNLTVSWAPQWHYALVVGYDLKNKTILLHTGYSAYESMDIEKFEESWQLADYWGLVVLPSDQISENASEWEHAKAVVGLEQVGQFYEAEKGYRAILKKWPNNLVAMIGLGNIAHQRGNRQVAVRWLKQAVKAHPKSLAARKNLAVAMQKN